MDVIETALAGVLILKPKRFRDTRGFFSESYNSRRLVEHGIDVAFVQDNLSLSVAAGTLRGLHYQTPPAAQDKLVSVLTGSVLDVAVDLRRSSPTFGQHVSVRLTAAEGEQLLVPVGFAHGFVTLEPDTLFTYKVSAYYAPDCDTGIRWDDPTLAIDWGVDPATVTTSPKDAALPPFDPDGAYFP